ncbi:hypothetical protein VC565_15390 [Citrobacter portucalensis]|nr:hypothetical protein [Citrobacter portucalensis]MEB0325010.1 hypothetical protein [Citrobacter portucalensis]MEB0357293.1 hypothetical protein [Citrobacter portucalensis]MEB0402613.1 hypothetical protein [Citrobacter portucalensis]
MLYQRSILYMTIKSIVINGKTILSTPNAINEGVWFDMLEVHQAAGLPANKTFSQWRSRQSRALEEAGEVSFDSVQKTLCGSFVAVLAYLMWADLTLWLAVVRYVASETIGVLPDRFKSIDGDNPEVEMSEDNSEWEDF